MTHENAIIDWSKRKTIYFFLPDGPYGRPFDNQYQIEKADCAENYLRIVLSEGVCLNFFGKIRAKEEGDKLYISDFDKLEFKIKDILKKQYVDGAVVLRRI